MEPPQPGEPGQFALGEPDRIEELVRGAGFETVGIEEVELELRTPGWERVPPPRDGARGQPATDARRPRRPTRAPRWTRPPASASSSTGATASTSCRASSLVTSATLEDRLAERARDEARRRALRSRSRDRGSGSPRPPRASPRGPTRRRARARGAPRDRTGRPARACPRPARPRDRARPCRARRARSRALRSAPATRGSRARSRPGRCRSSCTRRSRSRGSGRAPARRPPAARRARPAPDRAPEASTPRSRTGRRSRPSAAASGIPWTLPVGDVSGVLRSPCASIQSTPPDPVLAREAAERAERDGVVAAEHERHRSLLERPADETGDLPAGREDLRQVAGALVLLLRRLEHRRLDVAPVDAAVARDRSAAPRAPHSGSPRGPCRRRGAPPRGRGRRR